MKNNTGKVFIKLLIIIAVLAVVAFIAYRAGTSNDGLITKFTTDEEEYNKSEVLEEINLIITEKYLDAYNKSIAGDNKKDENKINEFYNPEKVIAYLKGYSGGDDGNINYEAEPDKTVFIEDLVDETDCYYVKIENFKRDITTRGKGKNEKGSNDYFFIKKDGEDYKLYYKNANSEVDEIGALQLEQSI